MPARPIDDRLLDFLADPASYPHRPANIQLIHTHISVVAIAHPLVFKVKKPVHLGFVDFSSLAKRRYFCRREVDLNRRMCPEIYLGVVPISKSGAGLVFGESDVVEYAVKMRYLEPEHLLSELVRSDSVTEVHLGRVVDRLARFYLAADPDAATAEWGSVRRLRVSIEENFQQTRSHTDTLVPRKTLGIIERYMGRFLSQRTDLLELRQHGGRILDCHGDLRLEHVNLAPDRTCIFDCIEFNDRFRFIDVASDVAFLAMDLDFHGRPDLASGLTRDMAERLNDPGLLEVLDFYKCYRAHVRAKVEGIRSEETDVPEPERRKSRDLARGLYGLALRYAAIGSNPHVIVLMGPAGVGKSSVAGLLAPRLGLSVISSDVVRKRMAGIPLRYRGSGGERKDLYAPIRTGETYAALLNEAVCHSGQSKSVFLDATFGTRVQRNDLRRGLEERRIPYVFVELRAPDHIIRKRLAERSERQDVVSDARLEDFAFLSSRYQSPSTAESIVSVDASGSLCDVVDAVLGSVARLTQSSGSIGPFSHS
jgi:aminoglycoside phosphotransferase family enzyme/predicted kinase